MSTVDPFADVIAAGALLLSLGSIAWQGIDAYRRRRRAMVEIHVSAFFDPARQGRPGRHESWVQVRISSIGGTFSTKAVEVELPESGGGLNTTNPDLGEGIPDQDQRPLTERIADPLHQRRTILDGEQTAWVFRLTGGPGDGVENTGSWVRAKVTMTTGEVIRSNWAWLWPDDPSRARAAPPPPMELGRQRRKG